MKDSQPVKTSDGGRRDRGTTVERETRRPVLNLIVWVFWTCLLVIWTPVVLAVFLLSFWWDRSLRATGRVFRWGARVLIWLNPFWRLEVIGQPPQRDSHPFVVVSNHESLADILLIGTVPWEMKWLSKRSIFRIPFLGWMMRLAGDVAVRREDEASRAEAYRELRRWLDAGMSVIIFPEGTRSPTSDLLPFRNGAFRLAIETGRPILPLAVSGTRHAIAKGSPRFGPASVKLRILQPLAVAGLGPNDAPRLRDRVRELIDEARRLP